MEERRRSERRGRRRHTGEGGARWLEKGAAQGERRALTERELEPSAEAGGGGVEPSTTGRGSAGRRGAPRRRGEGAELRCGGGQAAKVGRRRPSGKMGARDRERGSGGIGGGGLGHWGGERWLWAGRLGSIVGVSGPLPGRLANSVPGRASPRAEVTAQARARGAGRASPGTIWTGPGRAWTGPNWPCFGRANGLHGHLY